MRHSPFGIVSLIALLCALALATGCVKEKYDKPDGKPLVQEGGLAIDLAAPPALKKPFGILAVPVRVTNNRREEVKVLLHQCELEQPDGRRRLRIAPDAKTLAIAPGKYKDFKLVFGSMNSPVRGDSFRIYVWVETDRGRLIEDLNPLVLQGEDAFLAPPKPFARRESADHEFPPVEEWSTKNAARSRDLAECEECGVPRGGAAVCPGCGDGKTDVPDKGE